jgi:hypothetical protein
MKTKYSLVVQETHGNLVWIECGLTEHMIDNAKSGAYGDNHVTFVIPVYFEIYNNNSIIVDNSDGEVIEIHDVDFYQVGGTN